MLNILDPRRNVLINSQGVNGQINLLKLICSANQLTGFYMMGTLVVKELNPLTFQAHWRLFS